jgi:hypothetical protein
MKGGTLAVLALFAVGGSSALAAVRYRHTSAGSALARQVLLRRADLGSGWTVQAPAPKKPPALTCGSFDPALPAITQQGAGATATFQQSSNGPFVGQNAYAFASASQRQEFWHGVVRPQLVRCAAESLTRGAAEGVSFKVTRKQPLPLPQLRVPARGYRVSGTANAPDQSVDVYLDMVVLGRGKLVTELSFSSFYQPAPRQLELRLARRIVGRLSAQ